MKFNYGMEKKKFDENWKKIRKEYREAGMDEESIEKMYEYDWEMFKKERVWCAHNQYLDRRYLCLDNEIRESSHDFNPLFRRILDQLSYVFSEEDMEDGYAWMETLEDKRLYDAILSLEDEQKYYLKLRVIDGYNLEDIAEIFGVSAPAVHKRLNRIYGKIRKVYQEG